MEDGQSLSGTWSPAAQVTTASRQGAPGAGASVLTSGSVRGDHQGARGSAGASETVAWNDQQWAVVILSGFTLFAIIIAMVIQQVISWGNVSS